MGLREILLTGAVAMGIAHACPPMNSWSGLFVEGLLNTPTRIAANGKPYHAIEEPIIQNVIFADHGEETRLAFYPEGLGSEPMLGIQRAFSNVYGSDTILEALEPEDLDRPTLAYEIVSRDENGWYDLIGYEAVIDVCGDGIVDLHLTPLQGPYDEERF